MPTKKKSTTKTSVIRTRDNYRLRLTPTRLVQIDFTSARPWYVTEPALRTAFRKNSPYISIHQVCSEKMNPYCVVVDFNSESRFPKIGCCIFEDKVFRQILRHFGIRKSRKAGA